MGNINTRSDHKHISKAHFEWCSTMDFRSSNFTEKG